MDNNELSKPTPDHLFQNYFPSPDEIELDPKFNFQRGIDSLKRNIPNEKNSVDVHLLYKGKPPSRVLPATGESAADAGSRESRVRQPGRVKQRHMLFGLPGNRETVIGVATVFERQNPAHPERPGIRQFGANLQLVQVTRRWRCRLQPN